MARTVKKILIANRGEIAVRIIRACRELDIVPVAVYSEVDRSALHVHLAGEAYPLKGSKASETYLDQDAILAIALQAQCDAIHPGYGFLSENPVFAEAVAAKGLCFIGPTAEAIRLLGDKTAARKLAQSLNIPIVEGSPGPLNSPEAGEEIARKIGFPVLLKAAAGGGGKGMRAVEGIPEFRQAFAMAQSEAKNAFGDDRVYIEKYVRNPHHVEIQIVGDSFGSVVHLGERDCSIQRRHQKVIEESPSPIVDAQLRSQMGEAAVKLAKRAGYSNAGTVEFLVDEQKRFFFLEVNTRLQVEHPVTESVTDIDLVQTQIRVARGEQLPFHQEDIRWTGHAIECRVYAEDPENGFLPSIGPLERFVPPAGPRVRVDNGAQQGDRVQVFYDPMLAKVVAWGPSRENAIAAMSRALGEFEVTGIRTTIPFCQFVLHHKVFIDGAHSTGFVDQYFTPTALKSNGRNIDPHIAALAGAILLSSEEDRETVREKGGVQHSRWKARRVEGHQ